MSLWKKIKVRITWGNSAIHQIVIVNLFVFIFSTVILLIGKLFSFNPFEILQYFYLPADLDSFFGKPWTILTNIFFHQDIRHLAGNIITIYFIGRILEDFLDYKRVWTLFLFGGLAGGVLYIVLYNLIPNLYAIKEISVLLGASGGLAAIIAGSGIYLPQYTLHPFGLFAVRMKNAAVFILFVMLTYPFIYSNYGGFFAHLGGAIFGALYILNLQGKIELPTFEMERKQPRAMHKVTVDKKKLNKNEKTHASNVAKPNQEEIDAILDKISQSGYDSLNQSEKDTLFKASE